MSGGKTLQKSDVEDIWALTPVQAGLLFHYVSEPQSDWYREQLTLRLSGIREEQWFRRAWEHVVCVNPALRTVFRWEKLDKPVQVVLKTKPLALRIVSLEHLGAEAQETAIAQLQTEERRQLDLTEHPQRLVWVKLAERRHALMITHHHILYDGWSNGVMLQEWMEAYEALAGGREPKTAAKTGFNRYLRWLEQQNRERQRSFWQERLAGTDTKTALPYERTSAGASRTSLSQTVHLSRAAAEALNRLAKTEGWTAAAAWFTAWAVCLQKYNDQPDVVFGTTVSGRDAEVDGIDRVIGLFINTVPFRLVSEPGHTAAEAIRRADRFLQERRAYECTSLTDIQAWTADAPSAAFDSIVVVENYPLDARLAAGGTDAIERFDTFEMTNYPLTVAVTAGEGYTVKLIYHEDHFESAHIGRLASHLLHVMEQMVLAPDTLLADINLLDNRERAERLSLNPPAAPYPADVGIHQQFERQAETTPEALALLDRETKWTYRTLNENANRLAWRLLEDTSGALPVVAVLIERSPELIAAVMGILKAGGTYVPIDPDYPAERVAYLLERSSASVVITESKFKSGLFSTASASAKIIDIREAASAVGYRDDNPNLPYDPNQLIYVLYTSGSTGNPKGVMVKNHAFSNLLDWYTREFAMGPNDRTLLIAPSSFDLAQKNLFAPLLSGGTLCIHPPGPYDYREMSRLIEQYGATIVNCAPSAFYPLVDFNENSVYTRLRTLRLVVLGGEPINFAKLLPWMRSPQYYAEIANTYGPTECTDIAAFYRFRGRDIAPDQTLPIGKPISNAKLFVLNGQRQPVPEGVAGELYIGGIGVSAGYYNDVEMTRHRFLDAGDLDEGVIYRTGDRVRWLPDGNLDFLGRVDHQVKIRGVRMEPGEIESALLQLPGHREALVTEWMEPSGQKALCAYVVADGDWSADRTKEALRKRLPDYMVPAHMVRLERFPLTPNGKIDRKALPDPQFRTGTEMREASSETERKLRDIWRKVLGHDDFGIDDAFFEVGGNSVLLMQVHGQIDRWLPGEMQITDLFNQTSIAKLAAWIDSGLGRVESFEAEPVVVPTVSGPAALFGRSLSTDAKLPSAALNERESGLLAALAASLDARTEDVLLAAVMYLLSELSENPGIAFAATWDANGWTPQEADLTAYGDFAALTLEARRLRTESAGNERFAFARLADQAESRLAARKLAPLIAFGKDGSAAEGLEVADLAFVIYADQPTIRVHGYFAAERLLRENAESLLNWYMELLSNICNEFADSRSAAV